MGRKGLGGTDLTFQAAGQLYDKQLRAKEVRGATSHAISYLPDLLLP